LATPLSQFPELAVEIVEIAERAAQEDVPTEVAERPLDLALRLGPIRAQAFGRKP